MCKTLLGPVLDIHLSSPIERTRAEAFAAQHRGKFALPCEYVTSLCIAVVLSAETGYFDLLRARNNTASVFTQRHTGICCEP